MRLSANEAVAVRMNFGVGEELVQTMAHITRHCRTYRHEDERLVAKGDEAGRRLDEEYFFGCASSGSFGTLG